MRLALIVSIDFAEQLNLFISRVNFGTHTLSTLRSEWGKSIKFSLVLFDQFTENKIICLVAFWLAIFEMRVHISDNVRAFIYVL